MVQIQIRHLRSHLADTLAKVQEGQRVLIMKRHEPVAEIVPLGKVDPLERKLNAFAGRGMLIRARRHASGLGKGFKGFPAFRGSHLGAHVVKDRR